MSSRSTTLPLCFWYRGSSSEFWRWQRSINDAKWTFLPLVLDSSTTSFLFLTFVSWHAGIFSYFSVLFPLLPWLSVFLALEASEWICAQDFHESLNSSPWQWRDLDDVCVQLFPIWVSYIRRHRQYKRMWSCVSQNCGGFPHCSLWVFCKALLLASELPTFHERLSLWVWILRHLVQWRRFLAIVWHYQALASR